MGFFAPWLVYALVLALHLVLPAQRVRGYVCDAAGQPLEYRLNGVPVLLVTVAVWAAACTAGWLPWDFLWIHRWASLGGAVVLGLIFALAIVLAAPSTGRGFLADLYFGRLENPQILGGRVDLKMFLYLVGATMLELNLLSFTAHHLLGYPLEPSLGVLLHAAMLSWFVLDYLFFERVHLYTYDLFAERVGFKLGWGCLAFYPYFYAIGLWSTAALPSPTRPLVWSVAAVAVFVAGWCLARGANLQKFFFKLDPHHRFLGIFAPSVVTDGERTLLCSGFWRISRHVNYLGEILMATGLALVLGWPAVVGPWLYPLYYLVLLVPRERADRAMHARILAIKEEALGPEHPDVATSLSNLGGTYYSTGDYGEARRLLERSLEIREKVVPAGHPDLAQSLVNLGNTYQAAGDPDRAIPMLERALDLLETAYGPEHPEVALAIHNIANAHDAAKNYEEARRLGTRALPLLEKALGPEHPMVATSVRNLGHVQLLMGDARAALPNAERAVAIFERHEGDLAGELDAYFDLAQALVETGGDRVRARELAEHARAGWSGPESRSVENRAEVTAWLAANGMTE